MRLTELSRRANFALLSPGYSGAWTLLTDLEPAQGNANLLYSPFSAPPITVHGWRGHVAAVEPTLDVPVPRLFVHLDTRGYADKVNAIREAIAAGDVYQVNLTLRATLDGVDGAVIAGALCARGVPRFFAWVRLPDGTEFVSGSPELLFATEDGRVRAEPMKGTAPPGAGERLLHSAKDETELWMITDLVRNDLTPVCVEKSVAVPSPKRVTSLSYAEQTVSDIVGQLLPGMTPQRILRALHPGGSVTGAPKAAALELIAHLEPDPRGAYCGALGFVDNAKSVVSLLIRTAEKRENTWVYGVGGGIVYDSSASAEKRELFVKLGALGTFDVS